MGSDQSLQIRIKADADQALAELKSVTSSLKTLEKTVKSTESSNKQVASSFKSVEKATVRFSNTLKGLVAAYAGIAGAQRFIGTVSDLETGFIGVAKTTGLAGEEFEKLKNEIVDLSTEMAGVSIEELQSIAETAGQLGVTGSENILNFTETVAKLAVATDLTADQAASSFAKLANVLGEPISQLERMGSVVNELSNTTTATAADVVEVANRFAGMGKTFGLSTDQIFGFAAALKDVGLTSEVAGSAMTKMLGQMLAKSDKFAKFSGKSLKEWTDLVNKEPVAAIELFLENLSKLDKAAQVNALKDLGLGSVQTTGAVLKLSGAIQTVNKDLQTAAEEWKRNTSLQGEYETASRSLDAQWQQTQNTLKALAIKIGDELLPVIKQANEDFRKWVDGLDDEKIRSFASDIAGLVSGLASVAGAVGSFVASLGGFVAAYPKTALGLTILLKSLGGLHGALGLVTGAVGGTAAAMPQLASASATLSGAISGVSGAIGAVLSVLGPGGAAIAAAFAVAAGAMALYTDSVEKDIEANRRSAEQMNAHIEGLKLVGEAYNAANAEMQRHGGVAEQTQESIRRSLESEIASIEKQLKAWENNANATEEQNRAAMSLASTLGMLKAKLDTLDADYPIRITADTSEADEEIEDVGNKADSTTGTVKVEADASAAEAKIRQLEKTTHSTHIIHVKTVNEHAAGGYVQKYAEGGQVSAAAARYDRGGRVPGYDPTDSDTVNARLTRGEYVITRRAVDFYSPRLFDALNKMKLPKFAEGGGVSTAGSSPAPLQPINLNIGGKTFQAMADHEVAESLRRYLESEGGL